MSAKKIGGVLMVALVCFSAQADTVFNGGALGTASDWSNNTPGPGNPGTVDVNGALGNAAQNGLLFSGATVTVGSGATLTAGIDFPAAGGNQWLFTNSTVNLGDDFFSGPSFFTLNAGSSVNAVDDFQAQDNGGNITINGGTHTAGDGFGSQAGTSTLDFLGGSVVVGRFQFNVGVTIGGTAVATATSAIAADVDGTVNVLSGWSGWLRADSFTGSTWRDAVLAGTWTLDGAPIDGTLFDANFFVSTDGKTLSLTALPDPLIQQVGDSYYWYFTYLRQRDLDGTEIAYIPQYSSNPASGEWTDIDFMVSSITAVDSEMDLVSARGICDASDGELTVATNAIPLDFRLSNNNFEDPSVTDGTSVSGVTDWNNYIWPGWTGPVTQNPNLSTTIGPCFAMVGDNYAYIDAGGIWQSFDVEIEPETTYTLRCMIAQGSLSNPWYHFRLRCPERNIDLALSDKDTRPFEALNKWGSVSISWDSTGSDYVGLKLEAWFKGSRVAIDRVVLTSARTNPKLAYNPSPASGAHGVESSGQLAWQAGGGATSHRVYIGNDKAAVASADTGDPEYQGEQSSTDFTLSLSNGYGEYYWRIDEYSDGSWHPGNVWDFTTVASESHHPLSDTWVGTDAIGRTLPDYSQCGPVRQDKYVGLFAFIGHSLNNIDWPRDGLFYEMSGNSTETLAAQAPFSFKPYYWAEPELGNYFYYDEYVIRKHAQMFVDAGVDVLFIPWRDRVEAICDVYEKIRAEGGETPQFAFYILPGDRVSEEEALSFYEDIYLENEYQDLWFYWKGKPLMLTYGDPTGFSSTLQNFFTFRKCWAWDTASDYNSWSWYEYAPQTHSWSGEPEVPECVSVSVAGHPTQNRGRSYTSTGGQPAFDQYHLTPYTGQGLHFAEQWERALDLDPEFIFITGWNEWISACYQPNGETFLGHTPTAGDPDWYYFFVDMYNQEYSRDIEPMKGGHTDNYYFQMVDYIRQFKGVNSQPLPSTPKMIHIDGGFSDWNGVLPEFKDHMFDTFHRNIPAVGDNVPFVDTTGRNDFIDMKVARDTAYIFFYAKTRDAITPYTDPNWMMLFIDADQDPSTGWEGYDYLLNRAPSSGTTTLEQATTTNWSWTTVSSEIEYAVSGNEIEIRVPRSSIGQGGGFDPVALDFHWVDNIQADNDIIEFAVSGDSAPTRRFNYRYQTQEPDGTTLLSEDFESASGNDYWGDWDIVTSQAYSGSKSLECSSTDGTMVTPTVSTTGKDSFRVSFKYMIDGVDYDDVQLWYHNGSSWVAIELGAVQEDVWLYYSDVRLNSGDDAQFFHGALQFRITGASVDYGEAVWIDDFEVVCNVSPEQPAPTYEESYEMWAGTYGMDGGSGNGIMTADADGDGLDNLAEYGLGTDPLATNAGDGIVVEFSSSNMVYTFPRRLHAAELGLDYELVHKTNLLAAAAWTPVGTEADTSGIDAYFESVTNEAPTNLDQDFFRLEITVE